MECKNTIIHQPKNDLEIEYVLWSVQSLKRSPRCGLKNLERWCDS